MELRRKRLMFAIVGVLFVGLVLNAILTWGIVFDRDGGFEWSTKSLFKSIITNGYAHVRLGGERSNLRFCIPLVFWIYGIEAPPYPIRLSIRDDSGLLKTFNLDKIVIEHSDGQKNEYDIDWEREFKNKFSEMKENYIIDELPIKIEERKNCTIRFIGYFLNTEGETIPFDTTEYFEYEPYSWRIYPARGSF